MGKKQRLAFDGWGRLQVDLLCADARVRISCLQESGYLVLRFLADDVARDLDSELDGILRSWSSRRTPSVTYPLTVVRGSRV